MKKKEETTGQGGRMMIIESMIEKFKSIADDDRQPANVREAARRDAQGFAKALKARMAGR